MAQPEFRAATADDLPAIVAMLADDDLGRRREKPGLPLDPGYLTAFAAIAADPHQMPIVAILEGQVVGFLQITLIPGLSRVGAWRGQVESVRIKAEFRGQCLGAALMAHAIALCRSRGCSHVQLTTDKSRQDAHRFYARIGFVASHEGMKLAL